MFLFCSFLLHSPISLAARTSLIASPTWNYPVPKLSLRFSELAASNTLVSWRIAADIASTIIAAVHFMVIRLGPHCPQAARLSEPVCWRRACLRYRSKAPMTRDV